MSGGLEKSVSRRLLWLLTICAVSYVPVFAQDGGGFPADEETENASVGRATLHPPDRIASGQELPPPPSPGSSERTSAAATDSDRIRTLERQLEQIRRQLGQIDDELHDRPRSTDGPGKESNASTSAKPSDPPKKSYPTVKLTGFFQFDAGWVHQDARSFAEFAALGINPRGDIQDNRGFRRARLAAIGDAAENVSYMLEMDFAQPGRPTFQDLWLDIHDVPLFGNVRVGQWRQPFGLDELTSARELTFLERPTMFAFAPFRQPGIGFHDTNRDKSVTWAASGYGFSDDIFGSGVFGDRGYGLATRLTALPIYRDDGRFLLHIGGDYSYNEPHNHLLRYANAPEFFGTTNDTFPGAPPGIPFFVDTGLMPASSSNLFNAELAMVAGSFHAQSELRFATVDRDERSTVTFPSFYAQAGYILTGEVRPYNKDAAVLGRIKPKKDFGKCKGWGAWEVAGRYSYIDLNASDLLNVPIARNGFPPYGGRLSDLTAGLNWYLNANTKFQFQYVHAMLNRPPIGSSETDLYALRAQVDF